MSPIWRHPGISLSTSGRAKPIVRYAAEGVWRARECGRALHSCPAVGGFAVVRVGGCPAAGSEGDRRRQGSELRRVAGGRARRRLLRAGALADSDPGEDPAFATFYELPGRRLAKIRGGSKVVRQSNEALAYLESLFPGSIGEACFIDSGGAENARAVKGRIETIDKLSPDETKASFFAPTFALRPGQVYQSRPYVSPDTNEWVVANSAPVELPGRATPAIVHFEVTLESLRRSAVSLNSSYDIQIVDAAHRTADHRHPRSVRRRRAAGRQAEDASATGVGIATPCGLAHCGRPSSCI